MKAYTYYSRIDCLSDPDMIECWKQSWSKHGWEPIILDEMDARRADNEMVVRFERSPLMKSCPTNPHQYTRAAMMRWVAMTAVKEPCIHLDWDVMNNGFRPEHLRLCGNMPLFLAGSTCPCAIAATERGWKLYAALLELAPFLPSFSPEALLKDSCDQYAGTLFPPGTYAIEPDFPCKLYLEQAGWRTAPMIHFGNRITPKPRSTTIRSLGFI